MRESRKAKIEAVVGTALIVFAVLFMVYPSTTRADPPVPPAPGTIRTFQGDVNVTLDATDDWSGVKWTKIEIWYISIEDYDVEPQVWTEYLPEQNYTGDVMTLSTQGYYQLHYYSQDNAGNLEVIKRDTIRIWQDRKPPVTTATYDGIEITPT